MDMSRKDTKESPIVITTYQSLPRNTKYFYGIDTKVRLLTYNNNPQLLCDVRDYVRSKAYTGFTPKGIALNREQVVALLAMLPDILKDMETYENEHTVKDQQGQDTSLYWAREEASSIQETDQRLDSSTQVEGSISFEAEGDNQVSP